MITRRAGDVEERDREAALAREPAGAAAPPMPAAAVLALQRTAGNRAVDRALHGARMIQRAGDPEGMMVDHAKHSPVKMTFHHIIPENKLESLWERLEAKKHFKYIKTGLQSVTTRGLGQFEHAAVVNIKRDLNSEIKEVVGTWGDSKFEEIVAAAKLGGNNTELTKKFFPGLEKDDHEYHGSFLPIVGIFNRHFKVMGESSSAKISATVNPEKEEDLLGDEKAKPAVKKLIMWMPGNIHRGPTTRFTPKDTGMWFEALDDGGEKFETGARKVVSTTQFTTLTNLNKAIDDYLAASDNHELLANVSTYLDEMKTYSMTEYNPDLWEEVTRGGKRSKKAWTFKA